MGYSLGSWYYFLSGGVLLGSLVAGMFFFRFWSKTHDRLFALFGIAFWTMGVERAILTSFRDFDAEKHAYVYFLRLVAFVLILYGIVDKNRKERA